MNIWWVNHKQTFQHEFRGKYIWCPKFKRNGRPSVFYENLKKVVPRDLVFSFAHTRIQGAGLATSYCYSCPRPDEFGHIGEAWHSVGWRVDVDFRDFSHKIQPKVYAEQIKDLLPEKYAPIQKSGKGLQGAYLAQIPPALAEKLVQLIGPELQAVYELAGVGFGGVREEGEELPRLPESDFIGIQEWENTEEQKIKNSEMGETQKKALVTARRGQGKFKENVFGIEKECRITHVTNPAHLIASHIKPWRESNNRERLHACNGLLLTPSMDHLFDRGFISFSDQGECLISPVADKSSLLKMGLNPERPPRVGGFNVDQKYFLDHHRKNLFLNPIIKYRPS